MSQVARQAIGTKHAIDMYVISVAIPLWANRLLCLESIGPLSLASEAGSSISTGDDDDDPLKLLFNGVNGGCLAGRRVVVGDGGRLVGDMKKVSLGFCCCPPPPLIMNDGSLLNCGNSDDGTCPRPEAGILLKPGGCTTAVRVVGDVTRTNTSILACDQHQKGALVNCLITV